MLGTTLGITGFMIAYFQVLNHPQYPVTTMPLTTLDRVLPFLPPSLPLYLSLWVYVSLGPALIYRARELLSYGIATATMSLIGLGIFVFWPTAVPAADIDWSQHPSFQFLKQVDSAGNACPSLHVAFAIFTGLWLHRLLQEMGGTASLRALNWAWCLGIVVSTVTTRQHVVLDALAGAALGVAVAGAHFLCLRQSTPPLQLSSHASP